MKNFFKEEEKTSKMEQNSARGKIPAGGMADTVELDELQTQALSNRKVSDINKYSI